MISRPGVVVPFEGGIHARVDTDLRKEENN
jgi:hypothetical protein